MKVKFDRGVWFTEAYGYKGCIHIRKTVVYLGERKGYCGWVLELFTTYHKFKFTRGHTYS